MRNTVYAIPAGDFDPAQVRDSIEAMVVEVQQYVPGYRLTNPPVFNMRETPWGRKPVVTALLEVEGAGHFLPTYAGNLDIMTASARRVGEVFAQQLLSRREVLV